MTLLSYSGRNGEPSGATSSFQPSSFSAIGGRFSCVSTASTPLTRMAAPVSMRVMRPFVIVAATMLAWARPGVLNSAAYFAAPVTFATPSTRDVALPI